MQQMSRRAGSPCDTDREGRSGKEWPQRRVTGDCLKLGLEEENTVLLELLVETGDKGLN